MATDLTSGAVRTLVQSEGTSANPGFPSSVVQILKVIKVGGNQGQDRYRVILSDGQNFVQGMLATQLNQLVASGQIADNALIRVNDYMNNLVQNKNVIILLAVEVVNSQYGQKIGNPSDIEADPSAKAIVFSQFVSFLDVVEHRLLVAGAWHADASSIGSLCFTTFTFAASA